jgi:predicted ATPase
VITKFKVEHFKSIESAELELGKVNVFIGANGSGKSNLLEAVGLIAAAAFGRVDHESLLRRGSRPGSFFRPLFAGTPKDVSTEVSASWNGVTYSARLLSPEPDRKSGWEFHREMLTDNDAMLVNRETKPGEDKGDPQVGLAALKLAELIVTSQPAVLLKALAEFSIYTPDTPILRGRSPDPQVREPVGLAGGRLGDAISELINDRHAAELLSRELNSAVDWFAGFGVLNVQGPDAPKRSIAFMDRFIRREEKQFYLLSANDVNEGALYILFLCVLCLHPLAPRFFAIDNGDHGLNPLLAKQVVGAMCGWILQDEPSRQVLMTTHNPLVLDGLPLSDDRVRLFTVDRDSTGKTRVRRFVLTPEHLEKAKEGWTLSRMWVNGLIGGVPNV